MALKEGRRGTVGIGGGIIDDPAPTTLFVFSQTWTY